MISRFLSNTWPNKYLKPVIYTPFRFAALGIKLKWMSPFLRDSCAFKIARKNASLLGDERFKQQIEEQAGVPHLW